MGDDNNVTTVMHCYKIFKGNHFGKFFVICERNNFCHFLLKNCAEHTTIAMSATQKKVAISHNVVGSPKIYTFQLELEYRDEIPIWRTLEIPETYSFFDFHVAIQDSMSWSDCQLHKFNVHNPITKQIEYIGIPDDLMCEAIVPESTALIANYFSLLNCECTYMYNFVKPWNFRITLDKILPIIPNIKYPRCVAGNGVAPEDGPEESDELIWTLLPFELRSIKFRDPKEAWLDAFQGF